MADHARPLCFESYRKEREQRPAHLRSEPRPSLPSPFGPRLTERQVAHRRQMLRFARARVEKRS